MRVKLPGLRGKRRTKQSKTLRMFEVDRQAIGRRVRECRERLGWSQESLAESCLVGQDVVSRIESGQRTPSFRMLCALSVRFGMSMDWLVFGSSDADLRERLKWALRRKDEFYEMPPSPYCTAQNAPHALEYKH